MGIIQGLGFRCIIPLQHDGKMDIELETRVV